MPGPIRTLHFLWFSQAVHDFPVEKMREKYQRLGEIPFDSDRKLMSTVHKIGDNYKMLTKGAVDVLSGRINEVKTMDGKRPFTAEDLAELKKVNPHVESNIFRSVENVNLHTVIAYKKDGVKHSFLEGYDD